MMDQVKAREAIIELFERIPSGVSFVDIERALMMADLDPTGEFALMLEGNVLLWYGVNQEFIDLISELVEQKIITFAPTSYTVYLIDGKCPRLPLASRIPARGYKEPRWLPITFKQGVMWGVATGCMKNTG
jgi:hypothetical protein